MSVHVNDRVELAEVVNKHIKGVSTCQCEKLFNFSSSSLIDYKVSVSDFFIQSGKYTFFEDFSHFVVHCALVAETVFEKSSRCEKK